MHALEQAAGEHVQQDAGPQGAKLCRTSLPGRALPCKSSLTRPLVKAYSVRLGWLLGKTRLFGASDQESENGSSRPDRAASWCSRHPNRIERRGSLCDYAGRLRQRWLRQESELLAKEELRSKGIPEGVCRKQFPHVPRAALPPFQFPHETSRQADRERPSVGGVFLGVMEGHCKACEFC